MTTDFESRVLECIPEESELLLIEPMQNPRGLIELDDGRLLSTNIQGASTSSDGGKTWSETQPLRDANGDVIPGRMLYLQRLKSGAIGGFVIPKRDARDPLYGYDIAFSRSEDEGETWTTPVRASEPYNNTVMHGATVTHTGRIVASVYTLIGKTLRQPSRVLFGDNLARVGAHGWEHFFTYCFALISDDEGATWRTNEGKGKWGGGWRTVRDTRLQRRRTLARQRAGRRRGQPRPPAHGAPHAPGTLFPVPGRRTTARPGRTRSQRPWPRRSPPPRWSEYRARMTCC